MVRKQLIGMSLTPLAAATSRGTAVPACQQCPGSSPAQPLPAVASPRTCLTSAPLCDTTVTSLLNGATEDASRQPGVPCGPVGTRVICAFAKASKDAWHDRASGSLGASPRRSRCCTGKDAVGDGAPEKWGDVLAIEDGVRDGMRDSGEVVPCPSTTTGTDRMHDILRDSEAADHAASGASFQTWGRDKEIAARIEWGKGNNRCWLFGDGFLGGYPTDPTTPRPRGDRKTI